MRTDFAAGGAVPPCKAASALYKKELAGKTVAGIEGRHGYRLAKRCFDIAFSLIVLVAFCWLFAIKTRSEFSGKSISAFELPAKSRTNNGKAFSQVASCFASDLWMCCTSGHDCKRADKVEGRFLAKLVFGAVDA